MCAALKSKAVGTFLDKLLKRVAPLIMHWALGLTILWQWPSFGLWAPGSGQR